MIPGFIVPAISNAILTNSDNDAKADFEALFSCSENDNFSKERLCMLVNVESVDRCVKKLKLGKALGPDDLNAEHLYHAHTALAVHLCALFRSIILHSYVPNDFGSGIIIPLIKDKTGDVNNVNNYRGITLIPVISKLFELMILEICEEFLVCDELQFGFKKGVGCSEAIFTLRATIDYFKDRGSSVFVTISHYKLYCSLRNSGIPTWVITVLTLWTPGDG